MRKTLAALLVCGLCSVQASTLKPPPTEKVSVDQLEQSLSGVQAKSDAELAQALARLELTERLSSERAAHLDKNLPGEKSRQQLMILGDQSTFLPPPQDEVAADARPDVATTRQMLERIVNYVNVTVRQMPNLTAVRETTGFEDRPAEDRVTSIGTTSMSYLPLHYVGRSSLPVTYRDRKEVIDEKAAKSAKTGSSGSGLASTGEFGPLLTVVVADAIKGAITWQRWEQGSAGSIAVFHYVVPEPKSNYKVQFCCVANGFLGNGQPDLQLFNQRAAYHGEIAFNPADGSILRITLEAEMPPTELVPRAGMAIEYGPIEIGGKSIICPLRSVSLLQAHVAMPQGAQSRTNYRGEPKTFLNHVEFRDYRRFGSESRIISGF